MYIVFGDYDDYDEYVIGVYASLETAKQVAIEETDFLEVCGIEEIIVGPRSIWTKVYNTEDLRSELYAKYANRRESE